MGSAWRRQTRWRCPRLVPTRHRRWGSIRITNAPRSPSRSYSGSTRTRPALAWRVLATVKKPLSSRQPPISPGPWRTRRRRHVSAWRPPALTRSRPGGPTLCRSLGRQQRPKTCLKCIKICWDSHTRLSNTPWHPRPRSSAPVRTFFIKDKLWHRIYYKINAVWQICRTEYIWRNIRYFCILYNFSAPRWYMYSQISSLLMARRHQEPGHQLSWYWPLFTQCGCVPLKWPDDYIINIQ